MDTIASSANDEHFSTVRVERHTMYTDPLRRDTKAEIVVRYGGYIKAKSKGKCANCLRHVTAVTRAKG